MNNDNPDAVSTESEITHGSHQVVDAQVFIENYTLNPFFTIQIVPIYRFPLAKLISEDFVVDNYAVTRI